MCHSAHSKVIYICLQAKENESTFRLARDELKKELSEFEDIHGVSTSDLSHAVPEFEIDKVAQLSALLDTLQ